jgi:FMN-dependent NADH-azoreductase
LHRYSASGPIGLVGPKPVVVVETRGGLYSEGPAAGLDSPESHLRTMLGLMGLTDVEFVRVEKLGLGAAEEQIAAAAGLLSSFRLNSIE